jgi:hypothetical protein
MHNTVTVTANKPVEKRSPFLSIPRELRLTIYALALQDTISSMVTTSFGHTSPSKKTRPRPRPPIVGALALLSTSSEIRAESSDAMRSSCGVLARWVSAQNDFCITQATHAVAHGWDLGDMAGLESLLDDDRGRRGLMRSARLIIMKAYSNSRREMRKRRKRL